MQQLSTIARPYANATFMFAIEKNEVDQWQQWLHMTAFVSNQPQVKNVLKNPTISSQFFLEMMGELLGLEKDHPYQNFIHLLAHYHRLMLIPQIAILFDEARAIHEKILNVEVVSAFELNSQQQKSLIKALESRFEKTIRLHCKMDGDLISGAVVRAGNLVFDGSGSIYLEQLKEFL